MTTRGAAAYSMLVLVESFPTLKGVLDQWNPETLDTWADGPAPGTGALHAARFVLAVWNPRTEWKCGRFDLMEALHCWDDDHREAFLTWARKPWWP